MKIRYFVCACLISVFACQDFVAIEPPDYQITDRTVFQDEETARAAMTGLLVEMARAPDFNNSSIQVLTGLSSDEFIANRTDYVEFQNNDLQPNNPLLQSSLWRPGYRFVYLSNTIIEGLEKSSAISQALKNQLVGEASFIRAFCLWHLVNIYGEIPIILTTDLNYNATVKRANVIDVYTTILADLNAARELLKNDTINDRTSRLRPTYWAATAFLARVFLFRQEWGMAEQMASEVIDQGQETFRLESLESMFSFNSNEGIWQIQQVVPGVGTWDACAMVPGQGTPQLEITGHLLSAFESGDQRKYVWLDSVAAGSERLYYYPHKYRSLYAADEYHTEIRLAEVYLIRAEARVWLDKLSEAVKDLDHIRNRAGLPNVDPADITKLNLLEAIKAERRVELFAEGHRWYDLKRWSDADAQLDGLPYKDWQRTDGLYPVPQEEIEANNRLLPQNEGYN